MQKTVLYAPLLRSMGRSTRAWLSPGWSPRSSLYVPLPCCAALLGPVEHRHSRKSPWWRWGQFPPVAGRELGTVVIS